MAIYAFGASYGGIKDVSGDFIQKGVACVGWSRKDAPALHTILKHIKTGDIIYLKSHPPSIGLIIKAVGIVVGNEVKNYAGLGAGIRVRWVWTGADRLGQIQDRYPVRNLTLYEEFDYNVQTKIIEHFLEGNHEVITHRN
jgi:hypothetical protein